MFRNCDKGFILLEMLVALNILMFICLTLLPSYTLILNERNNLDLRQTGNELLSTELKAFINGGKPMLNRTVEAADTTYTLTWEFNVEHQKPQACISWNDQRNRLSERCGYGQ